MNDLTNADLIWNRACTGDLNGALDGDTALAMLLEFHGYAMNGGVLDAVECLGDERVAAAKEGYKFFGFVDVAHLISEAEAIAASAADLDLHEAVFDQRYHRLIPSDSTLSDRFEAVLRDKPAEFAPL